MHIRSIAVAICALLVEVPASAQTVELSERTFWLGEEPIELERSYPPFFAPQRIDWLYDVIQADPILGDTVIHVELALRPAAESVTRTHRGDIELGPDRVPEQFRLSRYTVYGSPITTSPRIDYYPIDGEAGYKVGCSMRDDRTTLSLCVILATYPPDDGIRLKARLYSPDNPADDPERFEEVVDRFRELVYCLDVTEGLVNVPEERPELTGCGPIERS